MSKEIKIIEAASESGAGKRGASLGPMAVMLEAKEQHLPIFNNRVWETVPGQNQLTGSNHTPFAKNIEVLVNTLNAVASSVEAAISKGYFPLIFSGDHSNAIGTVSGIKNLFASKRVGVIWVDAHLDMHSPYTTPSGNMHGMALNALLGKDNTEFKKNEPDAHTLDLWEKVKHCGNKAIYPKILPQDVVFIGVRNYENEEDVLVQQNSIKAFSPEDIHSSGMGKILEETLEYLADCDCIYVSFDVDSQDPSISSGTGTPVSNGLMTVESESIFKTLFHHPKVVAFEISEINPLLDTDNRMARSVVGLLKEVM